MAERKMAERKMAERKMAAQKTATRKTYVALLKNAVRIGVLALVAWGIYRTVDNARADFAAKDFSLSSLRIDWLFAAGGLYLVGLFPCVWFWRATMRAMQQDPSWLATIRAYYIGHLGKYVPGKALVVVLRTGYIRGPRVDTVVAATSVFVETLTMMAVGAAAAAVCLLATAERRNPQLYVLAIGILIATGVPTIPPIFRRIVRVLRLSSAQPKIQALVGGIGYRLMSFGWVFIAMGWILLGGSLWATLQAIPTVVDVSPEWSDLPLLIAAVALALVAGFLSLLPGGIGVREWVVMTLVEPKFGGGAAIISAVVLRLVWLMAELLVSAILVLIRTPDAAETSAAKL